MHQLFKKLTKTHVQSLRICLSTNGGDGGGGGGGRVHLFSKNSLSSSCPKMHVADPASEALWGPDYRVCIFSTRRKIVLCAYECVCAHKHTHIWVSMHTNPRQRKWRNLGTLRKKSWDKARAEGVLRRWVNLSNKLVVGWLGRAPCEGWYVYENNSVRGIEEHLPPTRNWNWNDDQRDAIRQRCAGR